MKLAIEIIGWTGAVTILAAYLLLSVGRIEARSVAYQAANVAGAACFIVNSGVNGAIPSATLNVVWMLIGVVALWRIRQVRRPAV